MPTFSYLYKLIHNLRLCHYAKGLADGLGAVFGGH